MKILTYWELEKIEARIDEIDQAVDALDERLPFYDDILSGYDDELAVLLETLEKSCRLARIKESGFKIVPKERAS